jgi:hypothetical protein
VIEDRDLYEPQKNHLIGGTITVRRHTNFTHGLEIPMAVTLLTSRHYRMCDNEIEHTCREGVITSWAA